MTLPSGVRVAWRAVAATADRRGTSRDLLADMLPGASFVSRCPACGGDHGRIRVLGVDAAVSVSYVTGWAVVAVALGHARIGVDAVLADAGGLERVLPRAAEARDWARAEAVLKADGRGLRVDPSRVTVRARPDEWVARVDEPDGRAPGPVRTTWDGWDLDGPADVVVALAIG